MAQTLYVPKLPAAQKHETIFKKLEELQGGESLTIVNDHDPKPLYYQLVALYGPLFQWEYIENGPEQWQVLITKTNTNENITVGQIVAGDIRKANVFKQFGIDFCCGGKKTLKQACADAGVAFSAVETALQNNVGSTSSKAIDYNNWDADFLADYIFNLHHKYYYQEGPIISELLKKVYTKHGSQHPELAQVYDLYMQLAAELNGHFLKEERVLFPFIKALVKAQKTGNFIDLQSQPSIEDPIRIMESDHDDAGAILAQLKKVTNNYTPPANSCNSFKFLYSKLQDLEEDLQQHIHLENNILFPKALHIEKALRN